VTALGSTWQHETDRGYVALRQLPGLLQSLPGWQAMVKGLAVGTQALEDDLWALTDETIDTAMGGFLDEWGALVGEARGALNDSDYRRFIKARILATNTTGARDELLEILRVASNALQVIHHDQYPAHFTLTYFRASWLATPVTDRLVRLMLDAKPAGVGLTLVEALEIPLGMSGASAITVGPLSGPGTGGGVLSRLIYRTP